MRHIGYLLAGLMMVATGLGVAALVAGLTGPLADLWVDFLFERFDCREPYFPFLMIAPVLVLPVLVVCYGMGRAVFGGGED